MCILISRKFPQLALQHLPARQGNPHFIPVTDAVYFVENPDFYRARRATGFVFKIGFSLGLLIICDEIIAEQNKMDRLVSYDSRFVLSCENALSANKEFIFLQFDRVQLLINAFIYHLNHGMIIYALTFLCIHNYY